MEGSTLSGQYMVCVWVLWLICMRVCYIYNYVTSIYIYLELC